MYEHFPREQVWVILYEDFASNPAAVYAGVLEFLGLAAEPDKTFPVINARKTVRSRRL